MNTIQRVRSTEKFTVIPNIVFQSGLSARAIGLLVYLLHLPDDWKLFKNHIYKALPEGKDAINGAWRQLEEAGFIRSEVIKGGGRGKLPEIRYFVYDLPQKVSENPQQCNLSEADNPQRKKAPLLKTNVLKTFPLTKVKGLPQKKADKEKKPKKEDPPPRQHWQAMVDGWMNFYASKFQGARPNFTRRQPAIFAELYDLLYARAKLKKADWTQDYAVGALNFFLSEAYKDEWLQKHFLVMNLVTQFDAVINRAKAESGTPTQKTGPPPASEGFEAELKYYQGRYLEGQLEQRLITHELYDKLAARNYVALNYYHTFPGSTPADQKKAAAIAWIAETAAKTKKQLHD